MLAVGLRPPGEGCEVQILHPGVALADEGDLAAKVEASRHSALRDIDERETRQRPGRSGIVDQHRAVTVQGNPNLPDAQHLAFAAGDGA